MKKNLKPSTQKRTGEKRKEEAFEQYRQTFLQVPKIDDRKPVFMSCHTRDRLDEIGVQTCALPISGRQKDERIGID